MQIGKAIGAVIFFITTLVVMQPIIAKAGTSKDDVEACIKALSDDPALAKIKSKVGLSGVTEQTFEMKTSNAYPTASEKKLITLWVDKVRSCYEIAGSQSEGPSKSKMTLLITGQYTKLEQRAIQLYDKKITYGAFARARDEDQIIFLKEAEEVNRAAEQVREQERKQAQLEQDRREQEWRQSQQARSQYEANERASRCETSRQNASTFCQQNNSGVVVNVSPYGNSNRSSKGFSQSGTDAVRDGMNAANCNYWSMKVNQDCR